MNVAAWKRKNDLRRLVARIKHPPWLYKRVGGLEITVRRAGGTVEVLGVVGDTYVPVWGGFGSGCEAGPPTEQKEQDG